MKFKSTYTNPPAKCPECGHNDFIKLEPEKGCILDICDENEAPDLYEALKWVYEYGPCSICRKSAVEHLIALKRIESEVIEECMFDAEEDLQKVVRELQAPK